MPARSVTVLSLLLAPAMVLAVLTAGAASAHEEREVTEPEPTGFPAYRDTGPSVVVCKPGSADVIETLPAAVRERNRALLERCRFEHIQQAVNWVRAEGRRGTRILVLPGVYREQPSRRAHDERFGAPLDRPDLADECRRIARETGDGERALTYAQQLTCPHLQNLVSVFGDRTPDDGSITCDSRLCGLQIEGTGARPYDVIIDGKLDTFLNGLKADRMRGLYLTNFAAQHFEFNGVYIIETSGATVDRVEGSFNHEYGFLSFVSHVRYQNCSGQANGDSAIYPGASPNMLKGTGLLSRQDDPTFATEVRNCRGHHNALGYSGTTGNAIHVYRSEFDHNSTGLATDSLFPGHPGTPQNHALWEDNLFHSNNVNYVARHAQRGQCTGPLPQRDYEDGAVCPAIPLPVGTGLFIAGGNYNWVKDNHFYDNWRQGTYQLWVPAELREGTAVPDAHLRRSCGPDGDQPCPPQETSHWNTYSGNRMAENPAHGAVQPNGADFGWDLEGQGNCWDRGGADANTSASGPVTYSGVDTADNRSEVPAFPGCQERESTYSPLSTNALEAGCIEFDAATNPDPAGCDWFDPVPMPQERQPAGPLLERLSAAKPVHQAVLASREGYPTGASTVVLAAAASPAEALAAAPLAHARGGPVLLSRGDRLSARTAAEIERLGASTVLLAGGRESLSPRLVADLRRLGFDRADVRRVGGPTPAATAAEVARSLPATDAFVVRTGRGGWREVGTVASVASLLERPVLFVGRDEVPKETRQLLAEQQIEAADLVGGTTSISEEVAGQLAASLDEVERIAGADRDRLALNLARFALQAGADPTELWLAGGDSAATAAAGSAVAVDEGIMLLADETVTGTPTATWLGEQPHHPDEATSVGDVLERVRLLGDTSVLGAGAGEDLRSSYGARRGDAEGDRSSGEPRWHASFESASGAAEVRETLAGAVELDVQILGLQPGHRYTATTRRGGCDSGPLSFRDGGRLSVSMTADRVGTAIGHHTAYAPAQDTPGSVTVTDSSGRRVACAHLR